MNNQFTSHYAIVSHNHGEDACYYLMSADNEYRFGSLADAIIFNTPKDVFNFLLNHPQLSDYGACYIQVAQVTLDRIKEAHREFFIEHKDTSNIEHWNLYLNYHRLSYVL